MTGSENLVLRLDWWDDTIGAFEPAKVLRQVRRAFPKVEIDPTDHQEVRLLRELEIWSQGERTPELRATLVRQSKELYRNNGPSYRFVIPFGPEVHVPGCVRRQEVWIEIPLEMPTAFREQLLAFLRSLKMGEPELGDRPEDADRSVVVDPKAAPERGGD